MADRCRQLSPARRPGKSATRRSSELCSGSWPVASNCAKAALRSMNGIPIALRQPERLLQLTRAPAPPQRITLSPALPIIGACERYEKEVQRASEIHSFGMTSNSAVPRRKGRAKAALPVVCYRLSSHSSPSTSFPCCSTCRIGKLDLNLSFLKAWLRARCLALGRQCTPPALNPLKYRRRTPRDTLAELTAFAVL